MTFGEKRFSYLLSAWLILLGGVLLREGLSLPRLRNLQEYEPGYYPLGLQTEDDREFRQLRKKLLTARPACEDYAATALILGLSLPIISYWRKAQYPLPEKPRKILLVGFGAVIASGLAEAGQAFLSLIQQWVHTPELAPAGW